MLAADLCWLSAGTFWAQARVLSRFYLVSFLGLSNLRAGSWVKLGEANGLSPGLAKLAQSRCTRSEEHAQLAKWHGNRLPHLETASQPLSF